MSLQPYNDLETLKEDGITRRLKEKDEGGERAKVDDTIFFELLTP